MNVQALSHLGLGHRLINQDAYYVSPRSAYPYLLIVADGMGGHQAGEVASHLALEAVVHYMGYELPSMREGAPMTIGLLPALPLEQMNDDAPIEDQLYEAMDWANLAVYNASVRDVSLRGMGTTMTLALIVRDKAWVAHVGDSRLYHYRTGNLVQVTQDHSLVAEMVQDGLITEDQARFDSRRNVITRSMGTQSYIETDMFTLEMRQGDRLLLCSDGLCGFLAHKSLLRAMANPPSIGAQRLMDMALSSSSTDNITLIAYEHEG